jgi:hypothetical protein
MRAIRSHECSQEMLRTTRAYALNHGECHAQAAPVFHDIRTARIGRPLAKCDSAIGALTERDRDEIDRSERRNNASGHSHAPHAHGAGSRSARARGSPRRVRGQRRPRRWVAPAATPEQRGPRKRASCLSYDPPGALAVSRRARVRGPLRLVTRKPNRRAVRGYGSLRQGFPFARRARPPDRTPASLRPLYRPSGGPHPDPAEP